MPTFDRECHVDEWSQPIIDHLTTTTDGTASLDTLVDHLIEHEPTAGDFDRQTVTYEVVHACLPTLAESGLVEFDERTETVRYRPPTEQ